MYDMKDTIVGVFDSGVGGLTTVDTIRAEIPGAQIIYHNDHIHCPYGERSKTELLRITSKIVQNLKEQGAEVIVIACNTATTQCIHELRKLFPDLSFIGTEPAIKLACEAKCKNILLMATPGTVKSVRTKEIITTCTKDAKVTLLPCPVLAKLIEDAVVVNGDKVIFQNNDMLQTRLADLLGSLADRDTFDAVVFGCTHYVYIESYIRKYFPQAEMFNGNLGVAKQVARVVNNSL